MKIKCCKAPNLKLTKKFAWIVSAILAVILAAGIVLCAVLGFNSSIKDVKTVTVSVDYYSYQMDGGDIESAVNGVFGVVGVEADDTRVSEKGAAGYDIVYIFDKDTSLDSLRTAKAGIDQKLAADFEDAIVSVSVEDVEIIGTVAKNYVGRGLIALVIFAVASFLYAWIRYRLFAALYLLGGNVLSVGLTTALIALVRIPVTPAVAAVIAASVLFTTVTVMAFFNKLRAAQKEDSAADKSAEELVSSSIAWAETATFAAMLGVALIVMICVGKAAIAWFSLAAILAILASAFLGLLFVPATFVPAKKLADKLAANKSTGYKGAKKGEKAKKSEEEIAD
ncbi:MAG: hypothetical protein IJY63_02290 [Clostridia bacterium]|nr:hypothetical protein [Clostridia bacterium]